MARAPKLTPEVQKKFLDAIAINTPFGKACALAGVGEPTVREWISRGKGEHATRKRTPLYAAFADAYARACAYATAHRLVRLEEIGKGGKVIFEKTTVVEKKDGSKVTTTEVRKTAPDPRPDMWALERTEPDFAPPQVKWALGLSEERKKSLVDLAQELAALTSRPWVDPRDRDLPPGAIITVEALPAPPACQECQAATDLSPTAKEDWHSFGHPEVKSFPHMPVSPRRLPQAGGDEPTE